MFSTTESMTALADVRDPRLAQLAQLSESAKIVPAQLQVVDIAALVKGASTGEGLGNQFLGSIRTTDAVLHVVRAFEDGAVAHPSGRVDPLDDAETIDLELILADQEAIERRLQRVAKTAKSGDRDAVAEQAALTRLTTWLDQGHPARSAGVEMPAHRRPADRQADPVRRQRGRQRQRRGGGAADRRMPASATRSASRSTPRSRPSWPSSPPRRPRPFWKTSGSISPRSTASAWRPTGCLT